MKKRFTIILLCLCMMLTLMPATVFAADGGTIYVGGVGLTGTADVPAYALTTADGAVTTTDADESNYNIKWDGSTLTLNNAMITRGSYEFYGTAAAAICSGAGFEIELIGDNTVAGSDGNSANGIYVSLGIFAEGDISISGSGAFLNVTGGTTTATGDYAYSSGIDAHDVTISSGKVEATGGDATGDGAESYGISAGEVTISSGTVTATAGIARANGGYAYSSGIYCDGDLTITGGTVEAMGNLSVDEGGGSEAYSYGIESYGDVKIENVTVYARGDQANYSAGIYIDGDITVESGSVNALGGRAVNHDDSDAAASAGITASGNINVNGGEVIAAVGLTEHGAADGIYAYGDINVNGGSVTATGASYTVDGVEPQYSGGIFSETGDITITGKSTVVNANGGCASDGITAIAAKAGDIVIKGGSVRADGAYGAYTSYEGIGNGLSALKDIYDGTGGNIIISGGVLAAVGYTDSLYYEGELIARPENTEITMDVLDDWMVDEDTWDLD